MLEGFFGAVFVGLIILGVFAVVYAVLLKLLLKAKYEYYVLSRLSIAGKMCLRQYTPRE